MVEDTISRKRMTPASGPLDDFRIIELAGIGPAPHCGQLLADMGAEVILVDRPGPPLPFLERRGKKSIVLNLQNPDSIEALLRLVEGADALIEGLRPGVVERLGVGPDICCQRNPKLVYGRMTGWGQSGPYAGMAGHDINYLSITGALHSIGNENQTPSPPANLLGDFGGGSTFLAIGVMAGLLKAQRTGQGDVVDAAITDGVMALMGTLYSLDSLGQWSPKRGSNMLDGGAPFYRCYKTQDDLYMAVGCIEPKFFKEMLEKLVIKHSLYGEQLDKSKWPTQHHLLENKFAQKTRQEWVQVFDGSDACVTPVLDYLEALEHPHNQARSSHEKIGTLIQPAGAPRFSNAAVTGARSLASHGAETLSVLQDLGFDEGAIQKMMQS